MYFPDQEWSATSNLFELSTGLRLSSDCRPAAAPPSPAVSRRRVWMRLLSSLGSTPAVTGAPSWASVISLLQLPIEAAACLSSCCSCRLRPLSASAVRFFCFSSPSAGRGSDPFSVYVCSLHVCAHPVSFHPLFPVVLAPCGFSRERAQYLPALFISALIYGRAASNTRCTLRGVPVRGGTFSTFMGQSEC